MCRFLDLEGDLRSAFIPSEIAIGEQWINLTIKHIVQIGRFEHQNAGIILLSNGHRIVTARGIRVPTNNRTPLLTVEIHGFISRKDHITSHHFPSFFWGFSSFRRGFCSLGRFFRWFCRRGCSFSRSLSGCCATACTKHKGKHEQYGQNCNSAFHFSPFKF